MELVYQYEKEKSKRLWNVTAQISERGAAFLLGLPWLVFATALSFKYSLL
jgi:hypothetical protein